LKNEDKQFLTVGDESKKQMNEGKTKTKTKIPRNHLPPKHPLPVLREEDVVRSSRRMKALLEKKKKKRKNMQKRRRKLPLKIPRKSEDEEEERESSLWKLLKRRKFPRKILERQFPK
jgi:hypothetical protein